MGRIELLVIEGTEVELHDGKAGRWVPVDDGDEDQDLWAADPELQRWVDAMRGATALEASRAQQTVSITQAALDLAASGYRVIPLDGKVPYLKDWPNRASTNPDEIGGWFRGWPRANVGIATGRGLLVIDCDGEAGIAALNALEQELGALPPTRTVRTGGGGAHLYFWLPPDVVLGNSVKKLGDKVDIRAEGGQVVAPPSLHSSGRLYTYVDDGPAATLPTTWVARLQALAEPKTSAPFALEDGELIAEGARDDTLFKLGSSLRAKGLTHTEILATLTATNQRCRPPLAAEDVERIARSAAKYAPGLSEPGGEVRHSGGGGVLVGAPLATARVSLPDFPTALLPQCMREFVESEAERLTLPTGMLATAALVTAAAAIGGTRKVRTDDRAHPVTLWGVVVAESGAGKTPALDAALQPYRDAASERDVERVSAWAKVFEWDNDRSADKGERPKPPAPLRVTDATTEALADVLQDAPRGVLLDVEELTAWATALDAYRPAGRGGPDRARYCSMWTGHGITIERKGKPPIVVTAPVVSLVGGIQPGVLGALNSRPDGLAQRLLYTVHIGHEEAYPSRHKPDPRVLDDWRITVNRLLKIGGIGLALPMTDAALDAWHDGRDRRVDAQRQHGYAALYSKMDSISARLALILTLTATPEAMTVDVSAVQDAWALCLDYFAPHGRAALAGTETVPADGEVRAFVGWLRDRMSGRASLRDIVKSGPGFMRTNDDALAVIKRAGGLVSEETTQNPKGGRGVQWFTLQ
jgi:Bifunctional DNA primase/polymerase, N-terminal/Protein of unknown function (DUF3987)/Primase C terminal 1 (PriCT-1)